MEAIKETVRSVMQGLKKKKSSPDDPARLLKKALTKKEQGHIKFHYFLGGTLHLEVDSSSWLYHFSLKKEDLLARLRQKAGTIKEIKLRIGEVK
jgi:hypothetical protein